MRPRASSERLDKLAIIENQTNLEWIMKNSQMLELKSDIKMIPRILSLSIYKFQSMREQQQYGQINGLDKKKISQFRGLLIYNNQFCLVLNDCFIEKKDINHLILEYIF